MQTNASYSKTTRTRPAKAVTTPKIVSRETKRWTRASTKRTFTGE